MQLEIIQFNQIEIIKPLWERLNAVHMNDSINFKEHFCEFTFEERCKDLELKEYIKIFILYEKEIPIGYSIATINNMSGEIDSLFVLEEYQNHGYGKTLVEKCLSWFELENCKKIGVAVVDGHESVFGFYEQFGFFPKVTYLQMKSTFTTDK